LPSITGRAAAWPDAAEAEDGRAVGHHGDGVAFDGEPASVLRLPGDGQADPRHTWHVDHREIVTVADRMLRVHLDLAAQVHQERTVAHLADADPRTLRIAYQLFRVLGVPGGDGDIDAEPVMPGCGDVEGGHRPASGLHGGGQLANRCPAAGTSSRTVIEYEADGTALITTSQSPRRRKERRVGY
jgi:hypothetical protein